MTPPMRSVGSRGLGVAGVGPANKANRIAPTGVKPIQNHAHRVRRYVGGTLRMRKSSSSAPAR